MNVKKSFFVLLSIISIMSAKAQSTEFTYDSLYGGQVVLGGQPIDVPDLGRWHYFAFDETAGITLKGKSAFELENVGGGNVGTEKINSDWKARTDWDFAFHAFDIRTNSGVAGDGNAGAIFIADTASAGETSLADIYTALTKAPIATYKADTIVSGTFYQSLASMPPIRTMSLSVCPATRKAADGATGAASDFATFSMQGSTENQMIIVLKTTSGKYVKIYLKQFFNEEGKPGYLKFDYEFIPLETTGIASVSTSSKHTLYPNPVSDQLHLNLSENADIAIYSVTGMLVKQLNAQSGLVSIPVSDLAKGIYMVKIASGNENQMQKIIVQ
jgi:hypothetical protein